MSRLLETIKIQDGKICNIAYHNNRLNQSRAQRFGTSDLIDLNDHLLISDFHQVGTFKCRVLYGSTIERIELHNYEVKAINSLQVVHNDIIDYSHKYEDRILLHQLYERRQDADDILIVKNGLITDSYYCNVALRSEEGKWHTPLNPLLKGTKRQKLLDQKLISAQDISLEALSKYKEISLFNSMIELGDVVISVSLIEMGPKYN